MAYSYNIIYADVSAYLVAYRCIISMAYSFLLAYYLRPHIPYPTSANTATMAPQLLLSLSFGSMWRCMFAYALYRGLGGPKVLSFLLLFHVLWYYRI
jgi:hypothetical protein